MAGATTEITVQIMVEDGFALATAIRAELDRRGQTLGSWCEAGGHSASALSRLLSGSSPRPYDELRDALARAFGFEREWLDDQLAG